MYMLYTDASEESINSQEWKGFEIDAVTFKKSLTEYNH